MSDVLEVRIEYIIKQLEEVVDLVKHLGDDYVPRREWAMKEAEQDSNSVVIHQRIDRVNHRIDALKSNNRANLAIAISMVCALSAVIGLIR